PRLGSLPYKAYRVVLKADTTYLISLLRTTPQVTLADFIIEDKTGKKLAASQDDRGKHIGAPTFAPPSDGEYRLVVIPATPGLGVFSLTLTAGRPTPRAVDKPAVTRPRARFKAV